MKKIILFLLPLLIFSCDDNSSAPKETKIVGMAIDSKTNLGIMNALIETSPPTETKLTGPDGSFTIESVEAGTFTIMASKADYINNSVQVSVIDGKTTAANILLTTLEEGNNPPGRPVLVYPPANSAINKESLLRWSCRDPEGGPMAYDVYFGDSPEPTELIAKDFTDTSMLMPDLTDKKEYYWKVTARDEYGLKSEGPVWNFTYDIESEENPVEENLLLYYDFEGSAKDKSGMGNHGVMKGNYSFTKYGVKGDCARLTGLQESGETGGHVLLPDLDLDRKNEFTISIWVYEEGFTYQDGNAYIMFGDYIMGCITIGHFRYHAWNVKRLLFGSGMAYNSLNPPYYYYEPLYYDYKANYQHNWVHYALTYKDRIMTAYVDGVMMGQKEQEVRVFNNNAGIGILWAEKGKKSFTRFIGSVDEVKIFDNALSAQEVMNLYKI